MNDEVDDIVRSRASPAGPGLTDGAQETMYKIMEAEPAPALPARRRRRTLLALPAALGALAASLAVVLTLGPASASALDVKDEGGYFVIEVKDMFAKPDVYQQQLRDAGLDIRLRLLPSTPSNVGSVAPSTVEPDGIEVVDRQEGCESAGGCPISIKVRRDFKGSAEVALGREARPGEKYEIITGFDALGELRPAGHAKEHDDQDRPVRGPSRERGDGGAQKLLPRPGHRQDLVRQEQASGRLPTREPVERTGHPAGLPCAAATTELAAPIHAVSRSTNKQGRFRESEAAFYLRRYCPWGATQPVAWGACRTCRR
ncbi:MULTISPECIES: hypothetical protein [unclassified Nonomuraea]|uniref:hypothetical protein n=1 Tax=unclassified Nonomuraea TaxID=2593643 RepID=UPI0033FDFA09